MYTTMAIRPTSGYATASMVLGIVGLFLGWCLLIPNILAVVFGHIALSKIRQTGVGGYGQAIAGLVMGYGYLTLIAIGGVVAVSTSH